MSRLRPRALRRNPTETERFLWVHLRRRQLGGHKFRRQQPLGPYIVGFVCIEKRLIVEVDGGQPAERIEKDAVRTGWLETQGFRVLRFWDPEVWKEIAAVKEVIWKALDGTGNPPS